MMPTLIVPNPKKGAHKWARPERIVDLLDWNGQLGKFRVSDEPPGADDLRPIYALNLNNQYRVDKELALTKSPRNPCVYDFMDSAMWEASLARDGVLLLDMAVEMLSARREIADGLANGVKANGIDPARVFVLNCNLRARDAFAAAFPEQMAQAPRILDFDSCFWMVAGLNKATDANTAAIMDRLARLDQFRNSDRNHNYVSFNGRARPHRFFVLLWLFANGLMQRSAVSFLGYGGKPEDGYERMRRASQKLNYPENETVLEDFDRFAASLPMALDVSLEESQADNAYKQTLPWRSQPAAHYDDAWFSIVIDTVFDVPDALFLTPIAFKSFMNASPFVYFGHFGALRRMRELGFQTFAPHINEDYDQEPDNKRRMAMALAECKRLAEASQSELKDLYNTLWPVLSHNYNHFFFEAQKNADAAFQKGIFEPMGIDLGA